MPSEPYANATLVAYRYHAQAAIESWRRACAPSRFLRQFAKQLLPGALVLDYGCGIGTDLAWLRRQGFRVEGLDGTLDFVLQARRRNPAVRIVHGRFEEIALAPLRYDGIWCNAALIHVPPQRLRLQLEKLRLALKPHGLLGMTLAWGRLKGLTRRDWIPGRYLAGYTRPEAEKFFRRWRILELKVVLGAVRRGRWIHILADTR